MGKCSKGILYLSRAMVKLVSSDCRMLFLKSWESCGRQIVPKLVNLGMPGDLS